MPTIPKLVAAICLAALAYFVSGMVVPLMPEGTDFGIFRPLNVLIGLVTGWVYVGRQHMETMAEGVSYGLTGAGILTGVSLFLQSSNEMIRLAMRHRYDGPVEAVAAVFQIGVEFGAVVFTIPVIAALAIGGFATGFVTYIVSLRWR
ncbi:TrgA family protein [Primorskyibacter aestuariivivens]|uniref:TrgA family protein n=1 Tax=Primorskyibacter aestuariivivens TaxID=1888912 RepID=UPI002301DBE5|nr:TrgA family protein [Primorskyibacter aestuariivivens]MDA7429866.1 TrgA family protein [Primorskyibacter aestuariivivens]